MDHEFNLAPGLESRIYSILKDVFYASNHNNLMLKALVLQENSDIVLHSTVAYFYRTVVHFYDCQYLSLLNGFLMLQHKDAFNTDIKGNGYIYRHNYKKVHCLHRLLNSVQVCC